MVPDRWVLPDPIRTAVAGRLASIASPVPDVSEPPLNELVGMIREQLTVRPRSVTYLVAQSLKGGWRSMTSRRIDELLDDRTEFIHLSATLWTLSPGVLLAERARHQVANTTPNPVAGRPRDDPLPGLPPRLHPERPAGLLKRRLPQDRVPPPPPATRPGGHRPGHPAPPGIHRLRMPRLRRTTTGRPTLRNLPHLHPPGRRRRSMPKLR